MTQVFEYKYVSNTGPYVVSSDFSLHILWFTLWNWGFPFSRSLFFLVSNSHESWSAVKVVCIFMTLCPFDSHHRLHIFFLWSAELQWLCSWVFTGWLGLHHTPWACTHDLCFKESPNTAPSVYKEPFVSMLIYSERGPYCNFNPLSLSHTHTHTHTHTHLCQIQPDLENHTRVSFTNIYLFFCQNTTLQCMVFQRMPRHDTTTV